MKPFEQLKKMKEIGLFEDLKKSGLVEEPEDLEELLRKYEDHPENIIDEKVTGGQTNYWYWGSRGCGNCPPGRPCT
jgi:hypothetical protein